jgi:hypothetical protein
MLRDLSISVSPILAVLLIVLTPFGTGQGAHRDQLLDPLFPHVHFGSGLLTSAQSAAASKISQRILKGDPTAPALGAGAGATSASLSIGITPPVPAWLALVPVGAYAWDLASLDAAPPMALAEPPPDPPPTAP